MTFPAKESSFWVMTITAEEEKEDEEHLKNTGTEDGGCVQFGNLIFIV